MTLGGRVPIGTKELKRTLGIARGAGAGRLARCLAGTPDKQALALTGIESLGQRKSYLGRLLDTGLSHEESRTADRQSNAPHCLPSCVFRGIALCPEPVEGSLSSLVLSPREGVDGNEGCRLHVRPLIGSFFCFCV